MKIIQTAAILIIAGIAIGVPFVQRQQVNKSQAEVLQASTQAGNSLSLAASAGQPQDRGALVVSPGNEFNVDLLLRTDTSINLIYANLRFPSNLLEVRSINNSVTSPYIIKRWLENPEESTPSGTINMLGAITAPGYTSSSAQPGLVTYLTFKAKIGTAGQTARVEFDNITGVYKNTDGTAVAQIAKSPLQIRIVPPCLQAQVCPTACGRPAGTVPSGQRLTDGTCGTTPCSATAACPTPTPIPTPTPTPTPVPTGVNIKGAVKIDGSDAVGANRFTAASCPGQPFQQVPGMKVSNPTLGDARWDCGPGYYFGSSVNSAVNLSGIQTFTIVPPSGYRCVDYTVYGAVTSQSRNGCTVTVNIPPTPTGITRDLFLWFGLAPAPQPPQPARASYSPKVLLLIFNPRMGDGRRVSEFFGWNDPMQMTNNLINDIRTASQGIVNYTVVEQQELDEFPIKADGFQIDVGGYESCVRSAGRTCHQPDMADYRAIINKVDACGKRNREEIDELWVFGGPWFGYWESNLAGRNAFWYNSSPTNGTTCQKLLPIMGFNYERQVGEMFEDFGHRTESTMRQVYGSWASGYGVTSAQANTNWDKFALLDNQSPGNGGCGNAHTAVNSIKVSGEYDWSSPGSVQSSCADFANYPNLTGTKQTVNCHTWGCNKYVYYKDFFFKNFPRGNGINPDGTLNNWWGYLVDPQNTIVGGQ